MKDSPAAVTQLIKKTKRKAIIKRGIHAADYWAYCNEVGCEVWDTIMEMEALGYSPVCMWLPERYKKPNTSTYVQGVEVPMDYDGAIPEGFDMIELPEAEYLQFQGEPFQEKDYQEAILAVQAVMNEYDPSIKGYEWDDKHPRIQLEPIGERGYIELRAVKEIYG